MWRYVLIALLLCVAGGLYWLFGDHAYYFRYRLTVDIEADGKVHSASSVIEVRYWWTELNGPKWAARVDAGIGPIVDLGRYGSVIAALRTDPLDERLRKEGYARKLPYDVPVALTGLPWKAYKLDRHPVRHAPPGKVALTTYLPNFIWVPPSNDWTEARQLWKDEFEALIGPGVRLVQVSLEPDPAGKTMVIPEPTPEVLLGLCSPDYLEARRQTRLAKAGSSYPSPYDVGAKYEYRPFRHKSICDFL